MEKFENKVLNQKTINNAVSTYFFMFFSWLFLFNKSNININNDFVKSHVKSSIIIHLGFIITYIIFISNSLFSSINFYGFTLNHIIAKTIFLLLLGLMILGMYKASKQESFIIKYHDNFIKKDNFIDIKGDIDNNEKEKVTIIIAHIPFIGFLNFGKYKKNNLIENVTKLNLIITTIMILLYISGNYNLSNLLLLFYSIYVVFVGINLFINDKIIKIHLEKIPSPKNLNIYIKAFLKYILNYFKEREFDNFSKILNEKIDNEKALNEKQEKELKTLKESKILTFLIYIPLVNLIFIFFKNNKYKIHIENGISITLLLSIYFILNWFNVIPSNYSILMIIPILFGIGYTKYELTYKMPLIHEIYSFIIIIKNILLLKGEKVNKIRKKDIEVNLKPKK